MLAVAHDRQWASLCRIIGREELSTDPRTATVAARKENETFVEQLVAEWASQRTRQEMVSALNARVSLLHRCWTLGILSRNRTSENGRSFVKSSILRRGNSALWCCPEIRQDAHARTHGRAVARTT